MSQTEKMMCKTNDSINTTLGGHFTVSPSLRD